MAMPLRTSLHSRIPEITVEIRVIAEEIEGRGADEIERAAKDRVPVRTGTLRNAIHTDKQREGTYVVAGDTEAWYGHIVEHGGVHSAPHPFLVPAFEEKKPGIEAEARIKLQRL